MKKEFYLEKIDNLEKKILLYQIYKSIFIEKLSKENFLKYINLSYIESFLFYNEHKISIGIGIFSTVENEVEIVNFGIKDSFRKQGFGYYILKNIIEIYKNNNKENIFLEVSTQNTYAINLYVKLGFKILNVREGYYKKNHGKKEDAYIMKKKTISS